MGGIIDRLRSLLGRGDDEDRAGSGDGDPSASMEQDMALEQVEQDMVNTRNDAFRKLTDTHGSVDDPRG